MLEDLYSVSMDLAELHVTKESLCIVFPNDQILIMNLMTSPSTLTDEHNPLSWLSQVDISLIGFVMSLVYLQGFLTHQN